MAEKFPSLMKTINLQTQKAQQTLNKKNIKKTTSRHIIIKLLKANDKEKFLKEARD